MTIKKAFSLTVFLLASVMTLVGVTGCRVRQTNQNNEQIDTGTQQNTNTSTRRVSGGSHDPFLSVNYSADNIGRPETSSRDSQYEQLDPMEQFFAQQRGFGNIMQNPVPPAMPFPGSPQQTTPAPTTYAPTYPQAQPIQSYSQPIQSQPIQRPLPVYPIAAGTDTATIVSAAEGMPQHVSLIYPSPEYGIIKLDKVMAKEATVAQPFTYSIIITNMTNTNLANVILTEELGNYFQLGSVNPPPLQQAEGQLMWRFESLGPKASERLEISGVPTHLEPIKNNTSVTYSVMSSSNIRVVKPELQLARKVPAEALLCDLIPIEYTVQNTGTGAARDVQIRETFPEGLVSENGKREVVFEVGTLLSGQSRTFTTSLRATKTGNFANQAEAVSSSNIHATSASTATSVLQPILTVVKEGPGRLYLGRPASYEVKVTNKGNGPARDAILEVILPAGVTEVEASAGADINGSKLTWRMGVVPANTVQVARVTYRPTTTGALTSTASVSAHCAEPATSAATTNVVGIPAVRMELIDLEDPIEVGGTVTYILTVTNEGSAPDRNIRIVAHIEDKLQYISSTGPTPGSTMGKTISFGPLRSLEPNEKATWRIQAKAASPGSVRFRVTMNSEQLTRPVESTEATFLYE
ncbi:hypothetical protein ACFL6U_06700 [Planctomycetota bacterium]